MLQNTDNQAPRSFFLRQLSSNPTTPPLSNRKGSTRAIKGQVGGTSPHSIQRRRTTASHMGRTDQSMAQDNSYHRRSKQQESGHRGKELLLPSRPVSWHPNSRSFDTPSGHFPTSEPALRNTIAGLQGLAVSSAATASAESPLRNPLPAGPNYAVNQLPTTMVPPTGFHESEFPHVDSHMVYPSYPSYAWPSQCQGYSSGMPPPYDSGFYPSTDISHPGWSQIPDFTSYIPSQAPDFLPPPCPAETPKTLAPGGASPLPKKRSKELVGMGLYDHPDDDIWSELEYGNTSFLCHLADPHRQSTGKGLKLEETWEPPKDQDGAEEEEAYSSDEAEEELPMAPAMSQGLPTFYAPYGDLSNQSFFFDNDDPYSSCVALDQSCIPQCQPRYPDPARENFLWC